jgi:CxxC-x17-CxxC domain-containing protein
MEYKDKVLKCVDCGADFVFTAGEQLFYADKGFRNEPKRCKTCKTKKGSAAGGGAQQARGASRMVTTTVCSQCGKETTVPFKVTQGRPVYCRECFQQRRAAGVS